jgi:hypothetical protein
MHRTLTRHTLSGLATAAVLLGLVGGSARAYESQSDQDIVSAFVSSAGVSPSGPRGTRITLPTDSGDLLVFAIVRGASGEAVLVDSILGVTRSTPLGFAYPTGSTWGSAIATRSGGEVVSCIVSSEGIRVLDLGDLTVPGPLEPVDLGVVAAGSGFEPASTELGIIAVLIGLVEVRVPAVSFRDAGGTSTYVADGSSNTMMLRRLAPTASFRVEIDGVEAGQVVDDLVGWN